MIEKFTYYQGYNSFTQSFGTLQVIVINYKGFKSQLTCLFD